MIDDWGDFGVMAGGASGALAGLLFVAVSIQRQDIAADDSLRASAAQTLTLLTVPIPMAAVLLAPGQSAVLVGAELIALGVVTGAVLAATGRVKHPEGVPRGRLARVLDRRTPSALTVGFFLLAGITGVVGHGGGLYWLVPAVIAALIGGVLNAWTFLIEPLARPR